ncbi:type I DNA topoisomerase [Veillonella parvula]|uniref:type I DNA topoisomerase n=1 Tax=Veillonella parvula TaxID=29466 RepID=UPI001D07BAE1|nr:type I DNA topoisomerase [Veillonella parvula]MCB7451198.1 type I DNA topoisomerase [Veillonella parvula]MCQ4955323.1 type I DNA topoisomerase [Veillonella parvula]MCQ4976614.1 type I DNA topoisomerase [Veillonella parvula]
MSIKRSIVIGEPKAASTSKDTKKKNTKKESTTIKRKVTKEALTPMGIVRDKSVLQTSVPPEQREPRVYNLDGKVLVIVESPAKSKTIEKFLGPNYVVKASMGHLRDLPKSQMGIDIEHGFTPRYSNLVTRKKVIDELVSYADESSAVLLATDPDREGEAISWHLAYILNVDPKSTCRITFNEITKNAVAEALETPRTIDMNMVDAQQARRVLDRIVGYKLSPLLWKKVCKGLSAGRVQSVAVRLICEREREIQAFEPQEYWTIEGNFETPKKESFKAELTHIKGEKIDITTESDAQAVVDAIGGEDAVVKNIEKRKRSRKAAPPFTTSTLQQDGVRKLSFGAKRTMMIAQHLYEGLEIGSYGHVGLITYMRTDSTRISKEMQVMAKDFILRNYGEEYYPSKPNVYGSKGSAQDAHEAIRPTSLELTPKMVEPFLSRDELKLYTLIWNRFMASQMAPQQNESTTIELNVKDDYTFKATGSRVIFPGFSAVYEDVKKEDAPQLPALKKNDAAHTVEVLPEQHFTQPPPRYSEASLIKTLEELGIGRPSTYAPILDTIVSRNYVENTNKQFVPTELGFVVVDFLISYFEKIINTGFTRDLEEELDAIASGKDTYVKVLSDFYEVFAQELEDASDVERIEIASMESDEICELCHSPMVYKFGRYGKFLACSNFPECKNTKPITVGTGVTCPKCKEGEIVERKSRRGRIFYGCNRYPQCDFTLWDKPTHDFCETCGSIMVEKTYKNGTVKKFCSNETCPTRPPKKTRKKKSEASEEPVKESKKSSKAKKEETTIE